MSVIENRNLQAIRKSARAALKQWDLSGTIKLCGNVENIVYELKRDTAQNLILRVTEESHKKKTQICAELEWIDFLVENQVSCARPIFSKNNRFLERIDPQTKLMMAVFEKAEGQLMQSKKNWNPRLARALGQLLGQMHKATKKYKTNPGSVKRLAFESVDHLKKAKKYLPRSEKLAWQEFNLMWSWLHSLPRNKNSFGLCHTDLHPRNYFITNDYKITAFDFDDCAYHFFAYDIAIAIDHFEAWFDYRPTMKKYPMSQFRRDFKKAYLKENNLSEIWWKRVDSFRRMRNIEMFVWFHKMFNMDKLNRRQKKWMQWQYESFAKPRCKYL